MLPPEYPTNVELTDLAGQLNELANSLLLTEEERSYLLKKAALQAHGEESSKDLEILGESVGPYTQFLLDEVVEQGCRPGVFVGFTPDQIGVIKKGIEDTRSEDLNFARSPLVF